MIIHKCDICGEEMFGAWLVINTDIDAVHSTINVAKLIPLKGKVEVCERCYDQLKYAFISLQRHRGKYI